MQRCLEHSKLTTENCWEAPWMRWKSGQQKPRRGGRTWSPDQAHLLSHLPGTEFSADPARVLALARKQVAQGVQTESFGTSSHCRNSTTKTTFGVGKINKPSVILAQTWQLKQTCFSFKNFSIAVPRGWADGGAPSCLRRCRHRGATPAAEGTSDWKPNKKNDKHVSWYVRGNHGSIVRSACLFFLKWMQKLNCTSGGLCHFDTFPALELELYSHWPCQTALSSWI